MSLVVKCPYADCGQKVTVRSVPDGEPCHCNHCGRPFRLSESQRERATVTNEDTTRDGAHFRSQSARLAGKPKHLGRFQIRSELGAGAFGEVFRAYDPVLEREVALKVPRPGVLDSAKIRARFLREPKAAAKLRHPNIVPVHDAGQDGDYFYIASAFISGHTLQRAIDEEPPDLQRSARIVRNLALALDYAHNAGVIHRDVKPANVMLDGHGEPMLMDFGLARLESTEEKLTQDGTLMGTPAYMAPEQASRQQGEVGPASDQYSLGVIFYELLCGQTPFSGPPHVVVFNLLNEDPPPPGTVGPQVPKDLETICLKAMTKQPSGRYANCGEMAADLRRWLDGEPIHARRLSLAERMSRWTQRNPTIAALLVAVILITLTGFLAVSSLWFRAERLRGVASKNAATAKENAEEAQAKSLQLREQTRELLRNRDELAESNRALEQQKSTLEQQKDSLEQQKAELEAKNKRIEDLLAKLKDGKISLDTAFEELRKNRDTLAEDRKRQRRQLYARQMQQAFEAFLEGNHDLAQDLLQNTKPSEGEEDLRSFPWHYLAGQYGLTGKAKVGARSDHLRHVGGITRLRFTPDGNSLISIGADLSVKVWDLQTCTCRTSFVPPRRLSFLATRPLPRYREERYSQSLAVSPDGRLVAVAALGGGALSIWNLATRRVIRFVEPETVQVRREPPVLLSPHVPTTFLQLRVTSDCFGAMTFDPEGRLAVISAHPTAALPHRVLNPQVPKKVFSTVSLSDQLVVGCSLTSRLINPVTREMIWETPSLASQAFLTCRVNVPAGNAIVPPPASPPLPIFGYVSTIRYSQFSPSGRLLAIACAPPQVEDGLARKSPSEGVSSVVIVDARTGELGPKISTLPWQAENRLAFSPDEKLLAILQFPEPPNSREAPNPTPMILLQELEYGRPRGMFPAERGVTSIRFAPDGKHLISWRGLTEHPSPRDRDNREMGKDVVFWSIDTRKVAYRLARHPAAVRSIDISPDDRLLASGSEDHTLRIWDLPTKLECGFFTDSTSPIRSVAFSPKGSMLATGNERGSIYLYRTRSLSFDDELDGPGTDFMILTDLGLHLEKDPASGAVSVLEVFPDTPARKAGFRPLDVVRQIGGKDVKDTDDVRWLTRVGPEGGDLSVVVERDSEEDELLLILDPVELNEADAGVEEAGHE